MTQKMIDRLIEMGASEWEKGANHRLYLNEAGEKLVGLTYTTYNSGQVSSARLDGETTTNADANRIIQVVNAAYYDMVTGEWVIAKPRGVKKYDYNKIREMLEEKIEAMTAETAAEQTEQTEQTIEEEAEMKKIRVEYKGGESRNTPGVGVDYMLATIDDIELYAETYTEQGDNENAHYDALRAAIIEQAAECGVDPSTLEFFYDHQTTSRPRPANGGEKGKTMKNYTTNTYTAANGETFRAVYCPELDEMAIETAGDIICTETDTIEDVLAGTPWADNETLDFADEWHELEDADELNSAGLRGWINAKKG